MDIVNAAGGGSGLGRPPAEHGEMNELVGGIAGLSLDTLPLSVERQFFFKILDETIGIDEHGKQCLEWLRWAFRKAQAKAHLIPKEPGEEEFTRIPLIFQSINPPRIDPNTLTPLLKENFEATINGSIKINTVGIRNLLTSRIEFTAEHKRIIEQILSEDRIKNWEYSFNTLYLDPHYPKIELATFLEIYSLKGHLAGGGAGGGGAGGGGAGAGAMEGGRRRKRTRTKRRKSKSKKSRRR